MRSFPSFQIMGVPSDFKGVYSSFIINFFFRTKFSKNSFDSNVNNDDGLIRNEMISNYINLLNTNINKRFHNYYFNNEENDKNEQRTNSGKKIYDITKEDKEEFKKKFDHDLYLK